MQWRLAFSVCLAILSLGCGGATKEGPPKMVVSAAADLQDVFTEIGPIFKQQTGVDATFNFGATGSLTQQIQAGAPVDFFAAANVGFIDKLEKLNLIIPETKAVYARGRLAVWTREESTFACRELADLKKPEFKKIAIADPAVAPYGAAAKEALTKADVWKVVEPKIVYGENIRQTLQYAETGNVDAAIVSLSLTKHRKGKTVVVPADLHSPLDQAFAVIRGAKQAAGARKFASYLLSPEGRKKLQEYGFESPYGAAP